MPALDMDEFVDYRTEYSQLIRDTKITGDSLVGKCPFHDDGHASLSVDLITGRWYCHAEDEGGNFTTFYAKLKNIDNKQAYKEILKKYGKAEIPEPSTQNTPQSSENAARRDSRSFTVQEYSLSKSLPVDFLAGKCGLSTAREKDGTRYVKIVYRDMNGDEATYRKRFANKEFRWKYGSGGKICLYGEWRIPEFRDSERLVLVEGESDTQTLWYLGIPALGVPGASMFKEQHVKALEGFNVYIHVEPDKGGETFLEKVTSALRRAGFAGEVYQWACSRIDGVKDPSDLYAKHGQKETADLIRAALDGAQEVDLNDSVIATAIEDAPIALRSPEGWIFSETGISLIDEKTFSPVSVCRTPVLLTQRLRSLDTGEEKVELAFKRDGAWTRAIMPRSNAFNNRGILQLADLGATVTTENAKDVVRFLGSLESENLELIPCNESTSTFGWKTRKRFLPGSDDGITLDTDRNLASMASGYTKSGDFGAWLDAMKTCRTNGIFRFILASSFAAPLLRITSSRNFMVYNWCDTQGGKTSALKAALSAWGDPDKTMINFNATKVGMEQTASLICDLPIGIDERQQASGGQQALDALIYMLGNGAGRTRGAKTGGVREILSWRSIALATGEEPINGSSSRGGVNTRVLQLYGAPYPDTQDAAKMYDIVAEHYGWAGPAFIERLTQCDERDIKDLFGVLKKAVTGRAEEGHASHIASVSLVALADMLFESWFVNPGEAMTDLDFVERLGITKRAMSDALANAINILNSQVVMNSQDDNQNAVDYINDWIAANRNLFTKDARPVLGEIKEESYGAEVFAYIIPSELEKALSHGGYNFRKVMMYLLEQGIVEAPASSSAAYKNQAKSKAYQMQRRLFGEQRAWVIKFRLPDDEEEPETAQPQQGVDVSDVYDPNMPF